ncbi:restriction endonuclease subunit S [Flavobacterium sp. CAN_S2]|uniref:restriction endonuclease subunit S n=1 Tax=Flavobacterium sp. CAN_S2 TaxID=2787726 RepID=UPI0018CB22EE
MNTATLHSEKKKILIPQLRFQEFNDKWMVKKFSALLKEGRLGGNYENSESNNGIPVIKMGNLGRGEININKVQFLPEDIEYNKEDVLIKGDLLFNTRNTLELVGKVSIWREELPFALYNSNLMRMKFNNEIETSNVFMNYYFNTKNSINQLRRFATGTTSVAAIYGKDLKGFNVAFPTLPEQQKIASFLRAVDEKIQQLSRKKELLEQYKKGVMQQLFFGKLRFKDENGKDYADWEEKKLGDIGTLKNGLNKDKTDFGFGSPFVNLMNVFGKSEIYNQEFDLVNSNEKEKILYNVLKGDVLFIRSSVKRSGVGETVIVQEDLLNTVYSGFLIRFRDDRKSLAQEFKKYCFSSQSFRDEILSYATSSANTNINQESLNKINVKLPCIQEQQKIANFLSGIDAKIEQVNGELVKTQLFKKGLLQQLFV